MDNGTHFDWKHFFLQTVISAVLIKKLNVLTHWGRVTHICVGKQTIIGSDNGLSPGRRQAIIWTNAGILLIGPLGTNFSEISNKLHFHSQKCVWKCRLRNVFHFVTSSMCQHTNYICIVVSQTWENTIPFVDHMNWSQARQSQQPHEVHIQTK